MRLFYLSIMLLVLLPVQAQNVSETTVEFIELTGQAAQGNAELSSLVWFGDTLLLIAENPQLYAEDGSFGSFFTLEKSSILEYLHSENPSALEPETFPIYADGLMQGLRENNALFDGFEAAAIVGENIYLQIETYTRGIPPMKSFIISGEISARGITLDIDSLLELPVQTNFPNLSYESLVASERDLIAIYEANGAEVNSDAVAYHISLESSEIHPLPMPNIPYRITDATEIDEAGNFWVINYFYPGEAFLATDSDPIAEQFGLGNSQGQYGGSIERLLELHLGDDGIELLPHSPIQLAMTEASHGRNWEGLARLEDLGILLITDKFPETLFGFVAFD